MTSTKEIGSEIDQILSGEKTAGFCRTQGLSFGSMDFICHKEEKKWGWRVRVGQFLADLGAAVRSLVQAERAGHVRVRPRRRKVRPLAGDLDL